MQIIIIAQNIISTAPGSRLDTFPAAGLYFVFDPERTDAHKDDHRQRYYSCHSPGKSGMRGKNAAQASR